MDGIVLISKPLGLTSFDVIACLRRMFKQKDIGHTGTLDPLADGLLVVALGKALRTVEYMENYDKGYIATVSFGQATSTYDREGQVTESGNPSVVTLNRLQAALKMFSGDIYQKPPIYSALKQNGRKLCDLARSGEPVEVKPRLVHIHAISLLGFNGQEAVLEISCSKGTYIRSLAHDLGQSLSCPAHLSSLTRTFCGPFRFEEAYSLQDLNLASEEGSLERYVLPLDSGLSYMVQTSVDGNALLDLKNGRSVFYAPPDGWSDRETVRVYGPGFLAAICRWDNETSLLYPQKVFI